MDSWSRQEALEGVQLCRTRMEDRVLVQSGEPLPTTLDVGISSIFGREGVPLVPVLGIVDEPAHFIQEARYPILPGQCPKESTKMAAALVIFSRETCNYSPSFCSSIDSNTRLQLSFNETSLSTNNEVPF